MPEHVVVLLLTPVGKVGRKQFKCQAPAPVSGPAATAIEPPKLEAIKAATSNRKIIFRATATSVSELRILAFFCV
jgi:hypothetical protein